MQVCHQVTCVELYQVCDSLSSMHVDKRLDNQLASDLLTTCSRLVITKLQAMQLQSDIGLTSAKQQSCNRLAATLNKIVV